MKKSTKRNNKPKKDQVQITISKKPDGAKLCGKCGHLRTPAGEPECLKGHSHFIARDCRDYDDVSVNRVAIFGGTTGMVLGGTGRD